MKRVRIAILLLAVGIALPSWLIVSRALSGLEFERTVRHQAVASRIFDEMERALSDLLAREEARPFEAYASGEPEPDGTNLTPFVMAYFQLDPDGTFRSHSTRTMEEPGETASPFETAVRDLFSTPRSRPEEAQSADLRKDSDDLVAGFELDVLAQQQTKQDAKKASKSPAAELSAGVESTTAYDVIENLNTAAEKRATRKQKVVVRPRSELYAAAGEPEREGALSDLFKAARSITSSDVEEGRHQRRETYAAASESGEARARSVAPKPGALSAPTSVAPGRLNAPSVARSSQAPKDEAAAARRSPEPAYAEGTVAGGAAGDRSSELDAEASGVDTPLTAGFSRTVRLAIDPMVGRTLHSDPDKLVLYRTVLVGQQAYRQGLLLDLDTLGRWLDERVLAERGLADLTGAVFGTEPSTDQAARAGEFRFAHHFGDPFDALYVALDVQPLPGMDRTGALYGLSAMLVAVTLLGLGAVYRMVSVVVSFAQRRSNFVAAVSHELKTPLTSIRMYGEMLRDGVARDEAKRSEYLETITDEAERLTRLINNVLEFSRLENNQRSVALVVGQLGPILVEVAEKLRPHATREGFELSVVAPDDLPSVHFDRDALLQILFNLADNAMKYAASATRKEIVLEAQPSDAGVSVRVRDFGPGVPRKHLAHVFEPFYRGEDELVRNTKGTGIGLALVRDLVSSMGARVACGNAEGGGFQVDIAFDAAS